MEGGWARHRPARGTCRCVPAQALPSCRPRLRPFPTRPRPSLPAATPHFASRCGLAGRFFPGGGRPWQGLHGPIASSSHFLEPPRKRRTQISEAWKPALKLLLPNLRLLKFPFHPDSVSGGTLTHDLQEVRTGSDFFVSFPDMLNEQIKQYQKQGYIVVF